MTRRFSNGVLMAQLTKLMAKDTPLHSTLKEERKRQSNRTANNSNTNRNSRGNGKVMIPVSRPIDTDEVEYDDILTELTFIYRGTPYLARRPHNTVTLTDLHTYNSSLSPYLWEDPHLQNLHYHLQVNWKTLPIHDLPDASSTTFILGDSDYSITKLGRDEDEEDTETSIPE